MTCTKRAYQDRTSARRGADKAAALNGHGMRAYACPDCGKWHITAQQMRGQDLKVLPWVRVNHDLFTAAFDGGQFVVMKVLGRWHADCPDGTRAGPFAGLGRAKQWCDAASFLPAARWPELRP